MINGFAMSVSRTARHRAAVADYIAAHFQQCQAPTHFLDVKVHAERQVIMMAGFYPVKQFPNGTKLGILRSRIRARTRTRARVRSANSSSTSSAVCTNFAPSLMS